MRLILCKWYARRRKIDIDTVWTAICPQSRDIHHARAAFTLYALHSQAWLFLGEEKAKELIGRLL